MFCLLCLGDIVEDSGDSLCSDVIVFPVPNPSQHLPFRTVHEQLYKKKQLDIFCLTVLFLSVVIVIVTMFPIHRVRASLLLTRVTMQLTVRGRVVMLNVIM